MLKSPICKTMAMVSAQLMLSVCPCLMHNPNCLNNHTAMSESIPRLSNKKATSSVQDVAEEKPAFGSR